MVDWEGVLAQDCPSKALFLKEFYDFFFLQVEGVPLNPRAEVDPEWGTIWHLSI